jgi:DNA-binding response OmpR family regulator
VYKKSINLNNLYVNNITSDIKNNTEKDVPNKNIEVILLENNKDIINNFVHNLDKNYFNLNVVNTLHSFQIYLQKNHLDVIVSGTDFPDGLLIEHKSLLQEKTISGFSPGWIVCAKNADPELREAFMLSGVDVYLLHPVTPEEVTASILRIWQRLRTFPRQWRLDVVSWKITAPNNREAKLLYREVCLVRALSSHPGVAVHRSDLASALGYSPAHFDPRSMEIMVRRLRKKILEQIDYELPVETAHGIGYAFTAPIIVIPESQSKTV